MCINSYPNAIRAYELFSASVFDLFTFPDDFHIQIARVRQEIFRAIEMLQ